jgi:hypothetical protein
LSRNGNDHCWKSLSRWQPGWKLQHGPKLGTEHHPNSRVLAWFFNWRKYKSSHNSQEGHCYGTLPHGHQCRLGVWDELTSNGMHCRPYSDSRQPSNPWSSCDHNAPGPWCHTHWPPVIVCSRQAKSFNGHQSPKKPACILLARPFFICWSICPSINLSFNTVLWHNDDMPPAKTCTT